MGDFLRGFNLPFFGYGHDFGRNAWGYDGLATSGWRVRQGFRRVRRGRALGIEFDLDPHDERRRGGEVFVDLETHAPLPCPSPSAPRPLDLDGASATLRLRLPPGSAGSPSAPNGIQLFFSTKLTSGGFATLYTPWRNIPPEWESAEAEIAAEVRGDAPTGFDARRVSQLGVRFRLNDAATAGAGGELELISLSIGSAPPVVFDFAEPLVSRELAGACEVCPADAPLVRVFVLCDGRAGIRFGADCEVLGLDDEFFADFDTLVEAASQRGVLLMPALLDFHWCHRAKVAGGVQMGGRSNVIRNPDLRLSFLSNVLEPLLCRYGSHPAIHSWDIINEPEWVTAGIASRHQPSTEADPVPVEAMRSFVRECAEAIHANTSHLATVGSAKPVWLQPWRDLGLDLYQFHWYESFAADCPFPWAECATLGLDKPCLIGEVPTAKTTIAAQEFLAAAQSAGYAGLLFWSSRARDSTSDLAAVRPRTTTTAV